MIRPFHHDDALQCQAIIDEHLHYYATDLSAEAKVYIRDTMTSAKLIAIAEQSFCLVAEYNGVAGMASLDAGAIKHVFVAKRMQGQGIGRMLLKQLEQEARKQNLKRLLVNSALNAIPFYRKLDFKLLNENTLWIGTIRIDQMLMEKSLEQ